MRIGEVAAAVGTTPRTIRYYEEIGLMPGAHDRAAGAHRVYSEQDVEQLTEILRLKELLGVSLEELRELVADQEARQLLRAEFLDPQTPPDRRRAILDDSAAIVARTQRLVDRRRAALDALDGELADRRERIAQRRGELQQAPAKT
ncbi:MerR family transcriptional regulator [Conexibacter sp. JD483]|uniref:MerR family transcriptional regulator n=1 Tax=unclassified Conexibacter TaxID=2627773 RepID=UPI0027167678|nr:MULTISPECIES: MerR family transcriptional regulator [unclassified Conexibacter]MDO8188244.1 MerR family transcriptional regulator [Conexibacter sp. CPCC 205706]MDO8201911.1 MerR family transcriptional regulator [Conexibacter sp. CPCC 205762]MDR9373033.1 MerR family transcriptional regulator [Conexibacter sp. JD483]